LGSTEKKTPKQPKSESKAQETNMTNALAVRTKEKDGATVAQPSAAELSVACTQMDAEVLGELVERNWDTVYGNALGLMFLVKEMKRRFKLLDRKRQVNGEYLAIRGFKSFNKWVGSFTGVSRRKFYYLLETEEKKNERNKNRRKGGKKDTDSSAFAARCADTKKALAEIQRQLNAHTQQTPVDVKPLEKQINLSVNEALNEFLALIAPEGCEVLQGDNGRWYLTKKDEDGEPPKAKKDTRKVHFLVGEGDPTLACHPGTKPTPRQLTAGNWDEVTCSACNTENPDPEKRRTALGLARKP
jgi:hypothetical protein